MFSLEFLLHHRYDLKKLVRIFFTRSQAFMHSESLELHKPSNGSTIVSRYYDWTSRFTVNIKSIIP